MNEAFRKYALAVAMVTLAAFVRDWLSPVLKDYSPFLLFAPAAMLAAWYSGLGSGLLALITGLVIGDYFFLPPVRKFGPHGLIEMLQICSYVTTTSVGLGLIAWLRLARKRAELSAEQLRLKNAQLDEEISMRVGIQGELERAQAQLMAHSQGLETLVQKRTARLRDALGSLEAFTYSMVHVMRAPLRAISGFAGILADDYRKCLEPAGMEYLERIAAASRQMDGLINAFLDYARIAAKETVMEVVALDLAAAEVVSRCGEMIRSRGASIDIRKRLGVVCGDRQLLEEVFAQLLSNALKFVNPGVAPAVQIFSEESAKSVRIYVRDNGIGIPTEYHSRIFEVFSQLHQQEVYPGAGVGLAIVKRAVERMNGKLGLESAPGVGSTFWIELEKAEQR